jgi:hypothetical protein
MIHGHMAFCFPCCSRYVTRGGGFQVPTWRDAPFPRSSEELIHSRSWQPPRKKNESCLDELRSQSCRLLPLCA